MEVRDLPRVAQGRAQSTQRQAECGFCARSDRARRERLFTAANIESLPSASIKSWCETWTEAKAIETEESTHARYKRVIERFTSFLGEAKSKRDLSTLQASDVARFRDREAKELSRSTANLGVKVLRICLGEAVRQGLLAVNPAVRVKLLKSTAESKRRAFTL